SEPGRVLYNEYFGGGMNAIVFQEMREARGLAYNAFANYNLPSKKGETESYFTHIITQNDKMMDCVRHFREIVDNMPQSDKAFDIAKDAVTKQMASQRTTKFGVINDYLAAERKGYDFDPNKKIFEDLQNVTLQDITDFEKAQMAGKVGRYIILGDEKELDMKALEQIAPIRRVSLEEVFGY
ncbi:MAG: insulinase family protein, partial [Bacteroidaceae bacterium]|nr:insulinase family protein [Bacteroidaceae bacterium]